MLNVYWKCNFLILFIILFSNLQECVIVLIYKQNNMRLRDMANLTGVVMELGFEPESSDLLASTAAGHPLILGPSVRWMLTVRERGGKQPAKGQRAALSWREAHTTISRWWCISSCKSESILNRLSCGFQSFLASHADCNSCILSMKTGQMEATSWLKRK